MQLAGLLFALASAVFNGSFAAFSKLPSAAIVHPIVFNVYVSLGVLMSSVLAIAFLPLVNEGPTFTPLGALAGLLFVGASSLSFIAATNVGLSTAQGVWRASEGRHEC